MSTPYQQAAAAIFNAGWWPIPLGERAKFPPPKGYTGEDGKAVTKDDVIAAALDPNTANIAIRLPREVIGIDVDAYGGKPGAATLAELEHHHGPLPATVMVTSRADGVSGIRLYRLPVGADEAKFRTGWAGIEIVRYGHRYAVAPPSIHPDTNAPYRWLTTTGEDADLPTPESLPELPEAWVVALAKDGVTNKEKAEAPAPVHGQAAPVRCGAGDRWLGDALHALQTGASRHDAAAAEAFRALRLLDFGHNCQAQIDTLGAAFINAISPDRPGGRRTAEVEWHGILTTAQAKVDADPYIGEKSCCGPVEYQALNPFEPDLSLNPDEIAEGSTWAPIDLTGYWTGEHQRPEPQIIYRQDGIGLLYTGKVHSIYGESESGKSWVAQIATATVLQRGGSVAYIDFEADPSSIVERLRALGMAWQQTRQLRYLRPEGPRHPLDPYWNDLLDTPTDLIVIDGVTESLTLWGGETKDNDAITNWNRTFPRALARATGAAVVTIDHVPKDKETRGRFAIGGQAKLAAIDGAAYLVEPLEPLAPGHLGRLTIRVTKDRPGAIREHAGQWRKNDRTQEAAVLVVDSRKPVVTWSFDVPLSEEEQAVIRAESLDQLIFDYVLTHPDCGKTAMMDGVNGDDHLKRERLSYLVGKGFITDTGGGGKGKRSILRATTHGEAVFGGQLRAFDDAV